MNPRDCAILPIVLFLSACDPRANKISVPSDRSAVLSDNGLELYSSRAKVLQASGGHLQKQTWIRIEVNSIEYKEIINSDNVMKGMVRSESSDLVASSHANDILSYNSKVSGSWIPGDFVFEAGFSGNRRSLAVFKQTINTGSGQRTLIFTSFR